MNATIIFRGEDWEVKGRMVDVKKSMDECQDIAIRYMSQMRDITTACILLGDRELVVNKATEWQKRNG